MTADDHTASAKTGRAEPHEAEKVRPTLDRQAQAEAVTYVPAPDEQPRGRTGNTSLPETIAHYRVERLLGRGGMGVVYQARDERLRRTVALKLMLGGNHNPDQVARFRAEAEAVAQLQHPGIVRVYDVGMYDQQHFIALEYIEGETLTEWIGRELHSPDLLARVFEAMVRAIAYAHEHDVIHRDLKPSNVFLETRADASGEALRSRSDSAPRRTTPTVAAGRSATAPANDPAVPTVGTDSDSEHSIPVVNPRILDFGLAKMLNDEDSELTQSGTILGTPAYMSPEQASGRIRDVGKGADIYGLGATLYAMLTGRAPFIGESPIEVLQLVQNEPPVAPRLLRPGMPRDLETICLKCLEKEPARRYASAELLAHDVANFIANRPIMARPVSFRRRLALFYRRNRTICRTVAVLLAVLVASTGYYIFRINKEIGVANANAVTARLAAIEANRQKAEVARQKEEVTRQYLLSTSRLLAARSAALRHENPVRSLLFGVEAIEVTHRAGLPLQPLAFQNLILRCAEVGGTPLLGHTEAIMGLTLTDDGKRLLTSGADRTLRVWDLSESVTGATHQTFIHPDHVTDVAASSGSEWIATSCADGFARLWNVETGDFVELETAELPLSCVRISPDGRWLAAGNRRGGVFAWSLAGDEAAILDSRLTLNRMPPFRIADLAFSPDGRWLSAAISQDGGQSMGTAIVWNLDSKNIAASRRQLYRDRIAVNRAVFSSDGSRLGVARSDGSLAFWDVAEEIGGRPMNVLRDHNDSVGAFLFSSDGKWLVSADATGVIIVWNLSSDEPKPVMRLREPNGRIPSLALSPDGNWLASASLPGVIRLWDLNDPGRRYDLLGHAAMANHLLFAPDSQYLISGDNNYEIRVWDVSRYGGGEVPVVLSSPTVPVNDVTFVSDGRFVTGFGEETIAIWNSGDDQPAQVLRAARIFSRRPVVPNRIAVSHDSGFLAATSNSDNAVRVWPLNSDAPDDDQLMLRAHRESVRCVAFRPHDLLLASGGSDATIRLWNLQDPDPASTVRVLDGHNGMVTALAFHPTKPDEMASVSLDGTLRLWRVENDPGPSVVLTPESESTAAGTARLNGVAYSSDGRWLAASGRNAVCLWDLSEPELSGGLQFLGRDYFTAIGFSHDARQLVAGDTQGQVYVWDLSSDNIDATEIILRGHGKWVSAVAFSPDDSQLVTASRDRTIRIWELRTDHLIEIARRTAGRTLNTEECEQLSVPLRPSVRPEAGNDSPVLEQ